MIKTLTHSLNQLPKNADVEVIVEYTYFKDDGDINTPPFYNVEIESVTTTIDVLTIFAWYTYDNLIAELQEVITEYESGDDGN